MAQAAAPRRRRCGRRSGTARVSASFSTSSAVAPTSTSPVGSASLTVPSGRGAHRALDADDVLAAHPVRGLAAGRLGIDDDLHDARGVADVEEDDAAVVAAAVDPSAHHDVAPDVGGAGGRPPGPCASCRRLFFPSSTATTRRARRAAPPPARRSAGPSPRPRSRSASARPSITPYTARDLSAAFHCAFTERSPYARSTRKPVLAQHRDQARHLGVAARAQPVDDERVDARRVAVENTPSASQAISNRSIPDPEADAREWARRRAARRAGRSALPRRSTFCAASTRSGRNSNVVLV